MEQKTLSDYTKLTPDHAFLKEWTAVYVHDFSGMTYSEQTWLAYKILSDIDDINVGRDGENQAEKPIKEVYRSSKEFSESTRLGLAAALLQNLHQRKHFDGEIVEVRLSSEAYEAFSKHCKKLNVSENQVLQQLLSDFVYDTEPHTVKASDVDQQPE